MFKMDNCKIYLYTLSSFRGEKNMNNKVQIYHFGCENCQKSFSLNVDEVTFEYEAKGGEKVSVIVVDGGGEAVMSTQTNDVAKKNEDGSPVFATATCQCGNLVRRNV